MKKKVLSMILVFIMLMSVIPSFAQEGTDMTVYLSVSQWGELVEDKNGNAMAYVSVGLTGKESYTLDDVLKVAHSIYYESGMNGYATSVGEWGLGIDKLWGDTSGKFGYLVNGEFAFGLGQIVENGDYIDAVVYKNWYPDTESYAVFDLHETEVYKDDSVELILYYASGYEESGKNIFSPCQGATITVNGKETAIVTDENGKAVIPFETIGTVVVSAKKEKTGKDQSVPEITAPVCVVTVNERPEIQIIHNIAKYYTQIDFESAGGNLPWIIADMAIYETLFPDSKYVLTEAQKQEALEYIVSAADETTRPGDMAKAILALRALGYDAKQVYTKNFETINIVEKLIALVDSDDEAVANIYTLPYVMIALYQGEGYATETQMQKLIQAALESKSAWQSLEDGTDAMTPMVLALAPYYNTNDEVKAVIDQTVEIVKSQQREDGLIDGFEGYEPASTGLTICALSAVGIDSLLVKNGENNLIDGLLSTANDELNQFPNAFATEQGFRGLLAWRLFMENKGKSMYDFLDFPMEEANVSGAENCPVIFNVTPSKAKVSIKGIEEFSKNCFDLEAGSYAYSVTASGYETVTGTLEVTADEEQNKVAKTIHVSLTKESFGDGGGAPVAPEQEEPEAEEDKNQETTDEASKVVFTEETFSDVGSEDWYYQAVKYAYENNLFQGTDKGFEPNTAMTRAMLVTVLYRLADPVETVAGNPFSDIPDNTWYTDSVNWAAKNKIISGMSATEFSPDADITREQLATIIYRYAVNNDYDMSVDDGLEQLSFSDVENISDYAIDAIKYVVQIGVMSGRGDNIFAPKDSATRAEVASMLMRFAEVNK